MYQIATLCFTRNCDKHYWSIGYNSGTHEIATALALAKSFVAACEALLPVKVQIKEISPYIADKHTLIFHFLTETWEDKDDTLARFRKHCNGEEL